MQVLRAGRVRRGDGAVWSFLQGVSARRAGFAALAALAILTFAPPASAQVPELFCPAPLAGPPAPIVPPVGLELALTCTNSTTHSEIDIPVAGTAITAPEPLQTQLTQVLAGPNGAAVQAELNALGVLGPPGPGSKQLIEATFNVTNTVVIGPGTVVFGPDLTLFIFIPAGNENIDVNQEFINFFDVFSGSQALTTKGVNWLSGDLYAAVQTQLLDDGFHFADMLLGQLRSGGFGAVSSGPLPFAPTYTAFGADFPLSDDALGYAGDLPTKAQKISATAYRGNGWTAWIAGTGAFARVKGNDDNFGFGYRTASMAGGVEKQAGLWLYGGAFSIGQSRLTQDLTNDSATIDSRRFAAYAAWRGPFTVSGVLAYGNHSIGADRLTMLPGVGTQASYTANSLDAGFEVSKIYSWNVVNVQPMLGLIYDGLWTGSFIEGGGSLLGINANAAYVDALKGYTGARFYRTFVTANGTKVTPELRARVAYDFLDGARGFSATFTGDPTATTFTVNGLQPDRTAALLGAGITAQFTPVWKAFANYDADLRSNEVAQVISGGIKATW
jgi:outer membrane autotransporter protein